MFFEVIASGPKRGMESRSGKLCVLHSAALVAILVVRGDMPDCGRAAGRAIWKFRVRQLVSQKELLERQVAERMVELREGHRRLSESKQQLLAAMDAAKLGSWSRDLISGEISGDERTHSIFGDTTGDAVDSEKLLSLVVPEDREAFTRFVEEQNDRAYRINLPDGSIRWIQVRGDVMRDESGGAVRAAGVVMDITEQKRAEQKWQRWNNSYARLRRSRL